MESLNKLQAYLISLPRHKQLLLGVIVLVVIVFIYNVFTTVKQPYTNIINHSNNKIEKLENTNSEPESNDGSMQTLNLDSEKINLTLFYAEWCGHCKRFMKETWGELKEKYGSNVEIKLNELNCTDIKTAIKTPAGKDIEGFPTLIINYKDKNGEYLEDEYRGGRSVQHLTTFLEKFTSEMKA
jgi:thiol-disulfide isomerase/thioredoxin